MNWARDQVHCATALPPGWAGSLQARLRKRLSGSDGRASAPQPRLDCGIAYDPHPESCDGKPKAVARQGDRVIRLIATKLARLRMTVGTLLVLALVLGWDVQRA